MIVGYGQNDNNIPLLLKTLLLILNELQKSTKTWIEQQALSSFTTRIATQQIMAILK